MVQTFLDRGSWVQNGGKIFPVTDEIKETQSGNKTMPTTARSGAGELSNLGCRAE